MCNIRLKHILIGAICLGVAYGLGRMSAEPTIIKEEVKIEDTTRVDSLVQERDYWREIAETERDTVFQRIPVPEPIEADGLKVYDVPYTDQNLTANIGLTVDGFLEDVTFEYYLRREFVRERETRVSELRVIERTRTITQTYDRRFNNDLEVGIKWDEDFNQSLYLQYRPQFRILGINLVGTAHISNNSYGAIGISKRF